MSLSTKLKQTNWNPWFCAQLSDLLFVRFVARTQQSFVSMQRVGVDDGGAMH